MGAYSPAPVVTPAMHERIMREVIEPAVRGLAAEGMPYTGFLYAGLMIAPDGTPNVLEFNCRLGDPETQPVLMRLESDLTLLCEAALAGRLDSVRATWDSRAALGVVMAAAGYPEQRAPGRRHRGARARRAAAGKGLPRRHAPEGRARSSPTAAGCCARSAWARTCRPPSARPMRSRTAMHWPGMQYRRDIGYRAVARESAAAVDRA